MARQTFLTHPKARRATFLLGIPFAHLVGLSELLWHTGYENGPEFRDEVDVELAAQWTGEPGKLAKVLVEVRLLDRREDGSLVIHDFFDHAPGYVTKRLQAEEKRREEGITISEQRRAAAMVRWQKGHKPHANDMQTDDGCIKPDASGMQKNDVCIATDANGCTTPPNPSLPIPSQPKKTCTAKSSRSKSNEEPAGFSEFWKVYPKKVAKQDGIKAWKALAPDEALTKVICTDVERRRQSQDWRKDAGQYIPHPATYLNKRRWEDETCEPVNNRTNGLAYDESMDAMYDGKI